MNGPLAHFSFLAQWGWAMREELIRLLEPTVTGLSYELVELELGQSGHRPLVRVFIDRRDGEPVGLDDCERISHAVEAVLDAEDPIQGTYQLEVSSPGFDRPLRTREHFRAHCGREGRIELKVPLEGRRRFRGLMKALEGDVLVIEVDGRDWRLPLDGIQKARLVPED
jgi:ribosome maturation factor RimP